MSTLLGIGGFDADLLERRLGGNWEGALREAKVELETIDELTTLRRHLTMITALGLLSAFSLGAGAGALMWMTSTSPVVVGFTFVLCTLLFLNALRLSNASMGFELTLSKHQVIARCASWKPPISGALVFGLFAAILSYFLALAVLSEQETGKAAWTAEHSRSIDSRIQGRRDAIVSRASDIEAAIEASQKRNEALEASKASIALELARFDTDVAPRIRQTLLASGALAQRIEAVSRHYPVQWAVLWLSFSLLAVSPFAWRYRSVAALRRYQLHRFTFYRGLIVRQYRDCRATESVLFARFLSANQLTRIEEETHEDPPFNTRPKPLGRLTGILVGHAS